MNHSLSFRLSQIALYGHLYYIPCTVLSDFELVLWHSWGGSLYSIPQLRIYSSDLTVLLLLNWFNKANNLLRRSLKASAKTNKIENGALISTKCTKEDKWSSYLQHLGAYYKWFAVVFRILIV